MSRKQLLERVFIIAAPFLLLAAAFVAKGAVVDFAGLFPDCKFYEILRLYCPGCGNTRSVLALMRGDIMSSLRFNITPMLFLVLGLLFYLEGVFYVFGRKVRLVPRKNWLLFLVLGLMFGYFVLRNFNPYLVP